MVLRVKKNEPFPADLILVDSSEDKGNCFIETKNLDGETNLKVRQTSKEVLSARKASGPGGFAGTIFSEMPNNDIHKFEGNIEVSSGPKIALNEGNMVLRGSILRNTDYVDGIAVFTGHDTKLM